MWLMIPYGDQVMSSSNIKIFKIVKVSFTNDKPNTNMFCNGIEVG